MWRFFNKLVSSNMDKGESSKQENDSQQSEISPKEGDKLHEEKAQTPSTAKGEQSSDSSDEHEEADFKYNYLSKLMKALKVSEKVLPEASLDAIVQYIKDRPNLKIVTMVGAGISTAAGIPDFRSPGTGIYHNLKRYKLPYPDAIFEMSYFKTNPEPFYHLAGELFPGSYKPTKSHYFIKLLQEKGILLRHYTQNIDNLERICGIAEDKLIEAHGTFNTSHCLKCNKSFELEWLKERITAKTIPKCTHCEGLVKPDIVFFGEQLPSKFYSNIANDFSSCELLLIMGSSLVVHPFASLVGKVKGSCPRLLINESKSGADMELQFWNPENRRDVFWKGNCDDGCQVLSDKLGWGEELLKMVETGNETLSKQLSK